MISLSPSLAPVSNFLSRKFLLQNSTDVYTSPSLLPFATTLLAVTTLLGAYHCRQFSLYEPRIGDTGIFLDSWPLKIGPIGCPETSVWNYHYSLRNNPEERSSHLLRGGSLITQRRRVAVYTFRQLYNETDFSLTKIEVLSMKQCMPSMWPTFICNLAIPQPPTLSMTGNTALCCTCSERTWSQ